MKLTRHAGLPDTILVTATASHVRIGMSAAVLVSTTMTTKYYILKRVHNIAQNIVLLCKQEIRQGVELNIFTTKRSLSHSRLTPAFH